MTIDEQGFITPIEQHKHNSVNYFANSQIYYKMENSTRDNFNQTRTSINNIKKIKSKNNCWICEGWREHHFSFKRDLHKFLSGDEESVYIHFSFEDYKPIELKKNENSDDYDIYRMCPPGEIFYYYTINDEIISSNQRRGALNLALTSSFMNNTGESMNTTRFSNTVFSNKSATITNHIGENIEISIKALCKYFHEFNKNVINEDYFSQIANCKPRQVNDEVIIIKPKSPWTFPHSIWSAYYGLSFGQETEVRILITILILL